MNEEKPRRALLVSAFKGASLRYTCEEHLEELALLARTWGIEVAEKIACPIRKFDASTFITEGKLEELVEKARTLDVEMVIFDDEIAPSQQRNLEKAFGRPVIDRTEVILGVFAQRAQTKEARLQIELAQVRYQAPRLKRLWSHLSRQAGTSGSGGGGAYLKGEGEKQIEIDRRILKKRIDLLQNEISEVRAIRETQRSARERADIPVFAIVGYTNAGKSTLLNALTDAEVLVEDKLFATLDTTTRKLTMTNNQEILLIDTVGFIRKLPHLLVAAFKSTLEEALFADILLHMVDVSHHMAEEQAATTFEVLKELGAEEKPMITVLNKVDQCHDRTMIDRIRLAYPRTVLISALRKRGFEELEEQMIEAISHQRRELFLRIPQSQYGVVSTIISQGQILNQEYEENDVLLRVSIPAALAGKLEKFRVK